MTTPTRKITESLKKDIAAKQSFKCKASVNDYQCPLFFNGRDGTFDEAGYEIDHIQEFSIEQNENEINLQALCLMCHRVKTKRFNRINKTKKEPTVKKAPTVKKEKDIYDINILIHEFNGNLIGNVKVKSIDIIFPSILNISKKVLIDKNNNLYDNDNLYNNQYKKVGEFKNDIVYDNRILLEDNTEKWTFGKRNIFGEITSVNDSNNIEYFPKYNDVNSQKIHNRYVIEKKEQRNFINV